MEVTGSLLRTFAEDRENVREDEEPYRLGPPPGRLQIAWASLNPTTSRTKRGYPSRISCGLNDDKLCAVGKAFLPTTGTDSTFARSVHSRGFRESRDPSTTRKNFNLSSPDYEKLTQRELCWSISEILSGHPTAMILKTSAAPELFELDESS